MGVTYGLKGLIIRTMLKKNTEPLMYNYNHIFLI